MLAPPGYQTPDYLTPGRGVSPGSYSAGPGLASQFTNTAYGDNKKWLHGSTTIAELAGSREGQDYANPEQRATAFGVQGVREGEARNIEGARQNAANQGLGRGFANQQEADIRQRGNFEASAMVLQAQEEGAARRYQQAVALAAALMEADQYAAVAYSQGRAEKRAKNAGILGSIGGILGGVASIASGPIGAGIGSLFGAGGDEKKDQQSGAGAAGGGIFAGLSSLFGG